MGTEPWCHGKEEDAVRLFDWFLKMLLLGCPIGSATTTVEDGLTGDISPMEADKAPGGPVGLSIATGHPALPYPLIMTSWKHSRTGLQLARCNGYGNQQATAETSGDKNRCTICGLVCTSRCMAGGWGLVDRALVTPNSRILFLSPGLSELLPLCSGTLEHWLAGIGSQPRQVGKWANEATL
ncbi:hypothetical protein MKZ38_003360 [Zalerion maritima]|uniref:4Fe-4S ferredoxin-type domain-containing protein n=1 Tax=Zalerion maritima TaxID=339359 RepID=A0AAD5WSH3_9PEZI|nr:hypothetical protein MKZ38_003360 [Zalerion maritima]